MKGGDSFGMNNATFGNIIIALNMFKYYIKVQYSNDSEKDKNGVYFFIFDLNENNFVTSYGLTNDILVNGNLDIRNSKSFLDLGINQKKYEALLSGKAYKKIGESDLFNEESGIDSTLKINIKENEIPYITLLLGEIQIPGTPNKLGTNIPANNNIESLQKLIENHNRSLEDYEKDESSGK